MNEGNGDDDQQEVTGGKMTQTNESRPDTSSDVATTSTSLESRLNARSKKQGARSTKPTTSRSRPGASKDVGTSPSLESKIAAKKEKGVGAHPASLEDRLAKRQATKIQGVDATDIIAAKKQLAGKSMVDRLADRQAPTQPLRATSRRLAPPSRDESTPEIPEPSTQVQREVPQPIPEDQSETNLEAYEIEVPDGPVEADTVPKEEALTPEVVDRNDQLKRRDKYIKIAIAIALLAVILIISIAVPLSKKSAVEAARTDFPSTVPSISPTFTSVPSLSPSTSPTDTRKVELREYLESISGEGSTRDTSSPQHKAYEWMYYEDMTPMNATNFLQRYALAVLYYSTSGDDWTYCSKDDILCKFGYSYLTADADECSWFRNKCIDGMITELIFVNRDEETQVVYGNNLRGQLPQELSLLTNLANIDMRLNELTGTIPDIFAGTQDLQLMSLENNMLKSPFPESFYTLQKLTILTMEYNPLGGQISPNFGNMSSLTTLQLRDNNLSGSIPSELGKLSNLEILFLRGNTLTGTIPEEIYNLSNIREIVVPINQLSGTISSRIGELTKLEKFDVRQCLMSGTLPSEIGGLTSILKLNLQANNFEGIIPEELGNLLEADTMTFNENSFSGTMPDAICNLNYIVRLWADCAEVSCDCCTNC